MRNRRARGVFSCAVAVAAVALCPLASAAEEPAPAAAEIADVAPPASLPDPPEPAADEPAALVPAPDTQDAQDAPAPDATAPPEPAGEGDHPRLLDAEASLTDSAASDSEASVSDSETSDSDSDSDSEASVSGAEVSISGAKASISDSQVSDSEGSRSEEGRAPMTLEQAAGLLDPREGEPTGAAAGATTGEAPPRDASRVVEAARALERESERFQAFVLGAAQDLAQRRNTSRAQILVVLVSALVLLLAAMLVRIAQGRGEIQVCIAYPIEMKGTFSIRLAQRKNGTRACRIKGPEEAARLGPSTRTEHHMVSRETSFRSLLPGLWYVSAEGFVQAGESSEVVATWCEELEVRVVRRQVARLDFDFHPRACPLEVRVDWDRRPVEGGLVARRGSPGSMRLARGPVHLSLDRGRHVLVAGSADRVAEVPVEIESFQPRQLVIDLANRETLLFTGCPPAVAPYLNGDVPAAARALERDGQTALANRVLARFHLEHDRKEPAARHFEAAGETQQAAELWQSLCQFEKAATLFEKAGDDERAAENFRSAGKLLRAGDAYARADAYDSAVECFRKAGDVSRWIDALEKKGALFAAALVALEQGEQARGLQCLHKVARTDPDYPDAVARLIESHAQANSLEIGLHKVDELIGTGRDAELPAERIDRLARLLEEGGGAERALALLERLRDRDATWPGVSTRVESLRKRRSRDSALQGPASAAETAFSSQFRYEILEELGRGGMGIVFKARDRRLGRVVALKRLPDNLRNHPKAVELFLREARAAAALNHPNIVTLFDAGQEGETYYITMELLEGMPLQKILRSRQRLSAGQVVRLGGQVATGLQYAHEQGIVHRDIKTANLFFTDSKLVKIMDFGLAKMVEEVRRATTVIGGTPYYMAPEQSAGDAVDHRADLYALGVTFYELLTGSVPFREGDVTFHHRHTPPPDPREAAPDLPEPLATLVLHLLAKRPEERVASATLVRQRLQEIARTLTP